MCPFIPQCNLYQKNVKNTMLQHIFFDVFLNLVDNVVHLVVIIFCNSQVVI